MEAIRAQGLLMKKLEMNARVLFDLAESIVEDRSDTSKIEATMGVQLLEARLRRSDFHQNLDFGWNKHSGGDFFHNRMVV